MRFSKAAGIFLIAACVCVFSPPLSSRDDPQKFTKNFGGVTFDSDYDNGSLGGVTASGPDAFEASLYAEPGELGERSYWFRFKITGAAGRELSIELPHRRNPRPVIRFPGEDWRRMTDVEAPDTSSLLIDFPPDKNEAELAFYYPLSYAECHDAVNDLVRECDFASSEVIGQSFQGRDLWMVSVTDPSVPDLSKRRVWLHARTHAGEATSTWTMLGYLEQATESSLLGAFLRRNFIFNIVPTVNPDGLWLGHTRWDSQGIDPERQWGFPERIPETAALRAQVDAFMAGEAPIEVALNLHSTQGDFQDAFFFKHIGPSVTERFEDIQQRYIDALDRATPLFENKNPQFSQLHPTQFIESYFWNNWGENVMAMTHEGHFHERVTDGGWATSDDYRELGRAMAVALLDYYDLDPSDSWLIY